MSGTKKEEPGRQISALIAGLFMSEANQERFHGACSDLGITPPALKALLSLEPGEAMPMRVLADQWRCDASWVTSLVDTLEERGLAERQILPTDRRVKTVVVTDLGVKAKEQALDRIAQPLSTLSRLTDAEQLQLRDLLEKLSTEG